MKRIYGNTSGLKANQIRRIENIYRRRIPPRLIATTDLVREMCRLSGEIRRQLGVMIDRRGRVIYVILGDRQRIVIPDTREWRVAPGRLRGLRCVHTHLDTEPLTADDLTDLAMLRLDLMAVITPESDGGAGQVQVGHILPDSRSDTPYLILPPLLPHEMDIDCAAFIRAIEAELAHKRPARHGRKGRETALLVSVSSAPRSQAIESLQELEELAASSEIEIVDRVLQLRSKANPRFLMGHGKLQQLAIQALQEGVTMIVFDQELNPSQIRSIADIIKLKVIDRTQLILDIFAQRAQTREGKLQVELAQLRYMLPRLVTKNTAMSRLTGGIGGRGPGETKLEINRRRVRERIQRLEKALDQVRKHRRQQRSQRSRNQMPVISIIGYTNAGKSTLLNALTNSKVLAESRLFATLDPSSRRLRFPQDIEVIITDTVGFIENLPKELMVAFRATLEELESADLLLHVIDISNPRFESQVVAVDKILGELHLDRIPEIRVLNKKDRVGPDRVDVWQRRYGGVPVSAIKRRTLIPLIDRMADTIEQIARHRIQTSHWDLKETG